MYTIVIIYITCSVLTTLAMLANPCQSCHLTTVATVSTLGQPGWIYFTLDNGGITGVVWTYFHCEKEWKVVSHGLNVPDRDCEYINCNPHQVLGPSLVPSTCGILMREEQWKSCLMNSLLLNWNFLQLSPSGTLLKTATLQTEVIELHLSSFDMFIPCVCLWSSYVRSSEVKLYLGRVALSAISWYQQGSCCYQKDKFLHTLFSNSLSWQWELVMQ